MVSTSLETARRDDVRRSALSASSALGRALAQYDLELINNVARLMGGVQLLRSEAALIRTAERDKPPPLPGEQRIRAVAEASVQLEVSVDPTCALAGVARLLVPTMADWVAIDLLDETGRTVRVASAIDRNVPTALCVALRNHHCARAVVGAKTARILDDRYRGLKRLSGLGLRSMIVAPLRSRHDLLGSLALARVQPNCQFGALDLALANNLAMLCALTVDNSRLYRAAHRAIAASDDFFAAASHELRTPLSHVKGFVSTLRRRDVDFESETREEFLAEVEREADRLAESLGILVDW